MSRRSRVGYHGRPMWLLLAFVATAVARTVATQPLSSVWVFCPGRCSYGQFCVSHNQLTLQSGGTPRRSSLRCPYGYLEYRNEHPFVFKHIVRCVDKIGSGCVSVEAPAPGSRIPGLLTTARSKSDCRRLLLSRLRARHCSHTCVRRATH